MSAEAQVETAKKALELHKSTCRAVHEEFPLLGLARIGHRNLRGLPIIFSHNPSLIDLYVKLGNVKDGKPKYAGGYVCKAVQTGVSELLIQMSLMHAGWNDRRISYVLPQDKTVSRFSDIRIEPLLLGVPMYRERTVGERSGAASDLGAGNLMRKRFGASGMMMFLGSKTTSNFIELSVDTMIIDEYDECDAGNVNRAFDRVLASPSPMFIAIGNPRATGVGIHGLWQSGNQQKFFFQCTRCRHRQPIDWYVSIVRRDDSGRWLPRDVERATNPGLGDIRPVCTRCQKPWDREVKGAHWVAARPSIPWLSWTMSRLDIMPTAAAPQPYRAMYHQFLMSIVDPKKLKSFHEGQLGQPWEPAGTRLTADNLRSSMKEPDLDYPGTARDYAKLTVVMGIDVGAVLNVSISWLEIDEDKNVVKRHGSMVCTVLKEDDVVDLQARFKVSIIVIDGQPETRMAKSLRDYFASEEFDEEKDSHPCTVWLCAFFTYPKLRSLEFASMELDYINHVATVMKSELLDATTEEILDGRKTFPADVGTVLGWYEQMQAPVRVVSDSGVVSWDRKGNPDHYRLADGYERLAAELAFRSGGFYEVNRSEGSNDEDGTTNLEAERARRNAARRASLRRR